MYLNMQGAAAPLGVCLNCRVVTWGNGFCPRPILCKKSTWPGCVLFYTDYWHARSVNCSCLKHEKCASLETGGCRVHQLKYRKSHSHILLSVTYPMFAYVVRTLILLPIALVSHTIRLGLKHTQFKHFEKINTDLYRRPSYRSRY